jgi:WD40 repeat protein
VTGDRQAAQQRLLDLLNDSANSVAVDSQGRRAVSGSDDGTVRVWNLESGQLSHTLSGHTDSVNSVAVDAEGRCAVSASADGTVRVWDLQIIPTTRMRFAHSGPVFSVAVDPLYRRAVSGGADGTVRVWDPATGAAVHTFEGDPLDEVLSVAVAGRRVFARRASGYYCIEVPDWIGGVREELSTNVRWFELGALDASLSVALRASSGEAVLGGEGTVQVVNLRSGDVVHTLLGHTGWVYSVATSLFRRRAVSGGEDCTVRVWNLNTGELIHTLSGHTGSVNSVAVDIQGRRAVSGSADGTVRVWDLESGLATLTLSGHIGEVKSVAVEKQGHLAVSAGMDRAVRVWDLQTGRCRTVFPCEDPVMSIAITFQSPWIVVVGDRAGRVQFFRIEDR